MMRAALLAATLNVISGAPSVMTGVVNPAIVARQVTPNVAILNNREEDDNEEATRDFALALPAAVVIPGIIKLPPSCKKKDLVFTRFPLSYVNGRDYFTGNYLDLDTDKDEKRDYRGKVGDEARTYDGHRGIDVGIPSFRQMDDNSAKIYSASHGVVTFVRSNQPDRNIGVWCPDLDPADRPKWNVVVVEAPNGFKIMYGHMKRNSPTVKKGDKVVPGQVLGVVGSSGCSTGPHLHFEVHDCDGKAVETFRSNIFSPDMWQNTISYEPPANVMDVMIKRNQFSGNQFVSPPPDRTLFAPGNVIGIAFVITFETNDAFELKVYSPSNSLWWSRSWNSGVSASGRRSKGRIHWSKTVGNTVGKYRVEAWCNGSLKKVKYFKVSTFSPYKKEIVVAGVPASQYSNTLLDVASAGYRPHLIDGYNRGNTAYLNTVWRKYTNGYLYWFGLTGTQYQAKFNSRPSGFRPICTQSYLQGGSVRYALIFKGIAGPAWKARHGLTVSQWNDVFASYKADGYTPTQVSVVSVNGKRYYTSYWEKRSIGSWYAKSNVRLVDYQAVYTAQTNAGRRLFYADAYRHGGVDYISVIFASVAPSYHEARHGLSQAGLYSKVASNNAYPVNRYTQVLTGYMSGSYHRYAAAWYRL